MGNLGTHPRGILRKFFAKTETTAGTYVKPAATDAIRVMSFKATPTYERRVREDNRTSRSQLERFSGKSTVGWTAEGYLIPSGTAGTPPDIHPLLKACFGAYANTPATSDVYTPSSANSVDTLSLEHEIEQVMLETLYGAWVEKFTLDVSGAAEPKVTFEGGAMGYAFMGATTLNGAMVATNTMTITDKQNVGINSRVKIGSDDNSGVGYKVTAVNYTTGAHTIESSISASNGAAVVPYVPSETVVGTPINGITGSFSVGGVGIPITAFKLEVSNNLKPLTDQAFTQWPADVIPMVRTVNASIGMRLRSDMLEYITPRLNRTYPAISVVIGSTAGSILTVAIPTAEADFSEIEVAGAEEAVITLPLVCLGSSGNDEVSLTFT